MKKLFLSLLVAAVAAFGFEDVEAFADNYKPIDSVLGDIMTPDGTVVGRAECRDGTYVIKFNVFNTNTKYSGIVEREYDRPDLTKTCGIMNYATVVQSGFEEDKYNLVGVYHSRDGKCAILKSKYDRVIPGSKDGDYTRYIETYTCMTTASPLDPFAKHPQLPYNSSLSKQQNYDNMVAAVNTWNEEHGKYDALWIDQGEERFRPTREEFQEIITGASAMGLVFDAELNWYVEMTATADKFIYKTAKGNPEYRFVRNSSLAWARNLDTEVNRYSSGLNTKYYYDCMPVNSARGTMEFYGYVVAYLENNRGEQTQAAVRAYPVIDSAGSYKCNTGMKGAEITPTEFFTYTRAGQHFLKPIYVKK